VGGPSEVEKVASDSRNDSKGCLLVTPEPDSLPREWFERIDPSPDALFYTAPRLVNHIDDATIAALTDTTARCSRRAARSST
jgi:hypothetical protein